MHNQLWFKIFEVKHIEEMMKETNWIASRNYRIRPRDLTNQPWLDICVSISAPIALHGQERYIGEIKVPTQMKYACTVQYGTVDRQSPVAGKDTLDAIFHGILAIENYLVTTSKNKEIHNINGEEFNYEVDGFLSGAIAREYYKAITNKE